MSTPDAITAKELPIVGTALEHIEKLGPQAASAVVKDFARIYLRRVHDGPLTKLPGDQLAAHVGGIFRFASDRGLNPVSVRVFNPSDVNDGYATRGTVVEISTADRPFLIDSVTGEIQSHGVGVDHVVHPVIGTERDEDGTLIAVGPAREADNRESIQHYQLDRLLNRQSSKSYTTASCAPWAMSAAPLMTSVYSRAAFCA